MERKEFDEIIKRIRDRGLRTILDVAGIGELSFDAIAFNNELEEKGFGLTSYYGPNFSRCWGIYEKDKGRPARINKCLISNKQYFHPKNRTTKKCRGYIALQELREEFDSFLNDRKVTATSKQSLPPGFSEEDFMPIEIKSIKKDKNGEILIELKPDIEKLDGVVYHYIKSGDKFLIKSNDEVVIAPGDNIVEISNELLAKRCVDHMNIYGEEYRNPVSIVNFIYSEIEFFRKMTKDELKRAIISDFKDDWTLSCPYDEPTQESKWIAAFGEPEVREKEVIAWLDTLTRSQVGGIVIMTAIFSSPNLAYILSKNTAGNQKKIIKYFDREYQKYRTQIGDVFYTPFDDLVKIFDNYIFWNELITD